MQQAASQIGLTGFSSPRDRHLSPVARHTRPSIERSLALLIRGDRLAGRPLVGFVLAGTLVAPIWGVAALATWVWLL